MDLIREVQSRIDKRSEKIFYLERSVTIGHYTRLSELDSMKESIQILVKEQKIDKKIMKALISKERIKKATGYWYD